MEEMLDAWDRTRQRIIRAATLVWDPPSDFAYEPSKLSIASSNRSHVPELQPAATMLSTIWDILQAVDRNQFSLLPLSHSFATTLIAIGEELALIVGGLSEEPHRLYERLFRPSKRSVAGY